MRQHIDTAPLWEVYRGTSECPLCELRAKTEASYVEFFLGASVMEPSARVEVNQRGFCACHNFMMFKTDNRLGLALITDTYMREVMAKVEASRQGAVKKSLFGKKDKSALTGAGITDTCILCDRLNDTMERYVYTLLSMWSKEKNFKEAFSQSKGLCLPHYFEILKAAPEELSGRELAEFVPLLENLEMENLQRVETDLDWFTQKFDYGNRDKPWGNSQDSVERAINKLRGKCVG